MKMIKGLAILTALTLLSSGCVASGRQQAAKASETAEASGTIAKGNSDISDSVGSSDGRSSDDSRGADDRGNSGKMLETNAGSPGDNSPGPDRGNMAGTADTNEVEQVDSPSPLPDEIPLAFVPLSLEELPTGDPQQEWKKIKSIPFGQWDKEQISLDIYQTPSEYELLPDPYHAVLRTAKHHVVLRDLSPSFKDDEVSHCPELCVFNRLFPGQSRYELIGSIELFANGPGLYAYVVLDRESGKLECFQAWGNGSFVDLEEDGQEEFVIEFPGLHLSPPDIQIVRTGSGAFESILSVIDRGVQGQGYYAQLVRDSHPPMIRIANSRTEREQPRDYVYRKGTLRSSNADE